MAIAVQASKSTRIQRLPHPVRPPGIPIIRSSQPHGRQRPLDCLQQREYGTNFQNRRIDRRSPPQSGQPPLALLICPMNQEEVEQ